MILKMHSYFMKMYLREIGACVEPVQTLDRFLGAGGGGAGKRSLHSGAHRNAIIGFP